MLIGRLSLSRLREGIGQVEGFRLATAGGGHGVRAAGIEVEAHGARCQVVADDRYLFAWEGTPRFVDESIRTTAASRGLAGAWSRLLDQSSSAETLFERVQGAYAALLVDARRDRIWLGCDRFAIHTMCYQLSNGVFRFGTRADLVAQMGSTELDAQAIYDYLYFHMIPAPRTVYEGVRRLPAAHVAAVSAAGVHVARHWQPCFDPGTGSTVDELARTFRERLLGSVQREAGCGQVAAFLSGGTDSSTVVGMLREATGERPRAYSVGFAVDGYDEMAFARIAARHFDAEHRELYICPADLLTAIPKVARYYDQPFGNSSAVAAYHCAAAAASDGIHRMLAGDGGDELFGGNTRYAKQQVFEIYQLLPAIVRTAVLEPALLHGTWSSKLPVVRKLASYVRQASVPMPARLNTYNLLERLDPERILSSDFLDRVDRSDPERQQRLEYGNAPGLLNRMLAYDWKYTLADNDLPKVCGTASLANVTVGFPLLADEIVDFSLQLPSRLKVRGFKLRYFFKEALRDFLPDAIIRKQKHGFGLPFGVWMVGDAALRTLAADSVDALVTRGLVRSEFVRDLFRSRVQEHPGYYGEMVWILMMLSQWLEGHGAQRSSFRPEPGVIASEVG